MPKVKFLIIGAGPTGLGAAYRLKDLSEDDYLILEKNEWVGGLATSFTDEKGFVWDIGGHVQFSHYKYFDDAMDAALGKDGWLNHERESWIWIKERFVPYPFQNNIRYLPKDVMWKCLKGLIELTKVKRTEPHNFREWILSSFGEGIADVFMLPYNFKVWAHDPALLNYKWIGERVSVLDLTRIVENILFEKDDVSWGPNNTFRFPKYGGTGAIWKSIADIVGGDKRIKLNSEVSKIYPDQKYLMLKDGGRIEYEYLLSSIPLDVLCGMIDGLPADLARSAGSLKHSSSNIVGIGVKGRTPAKLDTKCWMYFPESNSPFYRVTVFSNYSPNNVPDINSCFSLMAETSESEYKPVEHDRIIDETIRGLINSRLIDKNHEVLSRWYYRVSHGYPVPSLERDSILVQVQPELQKRGVFSRGRFGAWLYEVSNQDHSFMQGVEWVNLVLRGKKEETFQIEPQAR